MRYAIRLAYNGTAYHGWQKQENAHTVQAELDAALTVLLRTNIETTGCGRTDTGVHARNYMAHFDVLTEIPQELVYKINKILPQDIVVFSIIKVANTFHSRFDAVSREYAYYIRFSKDPFLQGQYWLRQNNLDYNKMNEAAHLLIGKKGFCCFCKGEPPNGNDVCDVISAKWEYNDKGAEFRILADRFLRNMVRAIVGTLIEVGNHKITLEEFQLILTQGNRSDAGNSVPAEGLFLEKVEY
jgi:tRNA pseudouridine38-40 synthase